MIERRRSSLRLVSLKPQPSSTPSTCSSTPAGNSSRASKVRLLEQPTSDRSPTPPAAHTAVLRSIIQAKWLLIEKAHLELLDREPHNAVAIQLAVEAWLWLAQDAFQQQQARRGR